MRIISLLFLLLPIQIEFSFAGGPDTVNPLPSLKEAIQTAIKLHPETDQNQVEYEVSKSYFTLLAKREQLGISDEVKGHFETAVTKADERMESDDGEVTQSAITKLKLGLSGTQNDISNFKADIQKSRLQLEFWTGKPIDENGEVTDEGLVVLKFPHQNFEAFQKSIDKTKKPVGKKLLEIQEAFVDVNNSREKLELARKVRKLTRALLVTEVANYDFGIGDEGDLFEALIIYTKVLVGYYGSIYQFNLSVLDVNRLYDSIP
ncbi:MAG: hypothetical protein G3M70_15485 [Candidatus Nitronauta litoralis]|uniref:TolC family protein n=1 Tax=Candidatus Nitronauta litoralis TaxID=2705533 RepID=A0A7T0G147_9BACT|nr:MAG: hypothetical protein G3M70_15485 [Candidatus Nitronauta litoralis]